MKLRSTVPQSASVGLPAFRPGAFWTLNPGDFADIPGLELVDLSRG